MIVVELLDGLGGEVVELVVGSLGVEPKDPFGGVEFPPEDSGGGLTLIGGNADASPAPLC